MSTISPENRISQESFSQNVSSLVDSLIEQKKITDLSESSVASMLAAIERSLLEQQNLNQRLGTFYTAERARKELGGISRQALSDRVKRKNLLRVVSSEGIHLYPAFQFQGGKVSPRLIRTLHTFFDHTDDPWIVQYWLTAPQEAFDGRTGVEILESGYDAEVEELLELAISEARVWSGQ